MAVAMDFFRRPRLIGNVVQRLQYATIHGAVRRNDADSTSSVPYFSGLGSGMSLTIMIDGVTLPTYTASFSGNGYADAIAAINTALGSHGLAFDTDGSISIQTMTQGGSGAVEVVGGTAAVILGFGVNGSGVRSSGGDLNYTPEDRLGNESSTAFPGPGEGLSVDVINRSLGRLSGNLDVLFADDVRDRAVLQEVTGFTVSTDGTYISLPAGTRAFTGYGLLSANSVKEDLAPFFMVLDANSRTPSASKVVGLVRGIPSGPLPYANSPSFSDTTGKNVLGQNLAKLSAVPINSSGGIQYGRYIECTGTTFTQIVSVGDIVQIIGATNTIPWSNNGMRWVVEEVVSDLILAVRPMSQSEMTLYGVTVTDAQPVLELNGAISGGQTYGTMTVWTGTYSQIVGATPGAQSLNVVISPPLPASSSIELWVAQPLSYRAEQPASHGEGDSLPYLDMVTSYRTLPDCIVAGFAISFGSGNIVIGPGVVRLDGRLVNHPGKTFVGVSTSVPTYFWYDPLTADLASGASLPVSRTPADVLGTSVTTTSLFPIALSKVNGASLTGYRNLVRAETLSARTVTVGTGGQFSTLEGAIDFINAWAAEMGESGLNQYGGYAHWEVVLVSGITLSDSNPVTIEAPSVKIRGASPLLQINCTSSNGYIWLNGCRTFALEDVRIINSIGNDQPFIVSDSTLVDVILRNVQQLSSANGFRHVFFTNSGSAARVIIDNCYFNFYRGIVWASPDTTSRVFISRSVFTHVSGYASATVCIASNTGGNWTGREVHIDGCQFASLTPIDSTPFLIKSDVVGAGVVEIRANQFSFGSISSSVIGTLISSIGSENLVVDSNVIGSSTNPINIAVAGTATSSVTGNYLYVMPQGTNAVGCTCGSAFRNYVTIVNPSTSYNNTQNAGVAALNAVGNTIVGPSLASIALLVVGLVSDSMLGEASNNYIESNYSAGNGSLIVAYGSFSNNTVSGAVTLIAPAGLTRLFSGNLFESAVTIIGALSFGEGPIDFTANYVGGLLQSDHNGTSISMSNCTLAGGLSLEIPSVTMSGCAVSGAMTIDYLTYLSMSGCSFSSSGGPALIEGDGSSNASILIENSAFTGDGGGIELASFGSSTSISIVGNSFVVTSVTHTNACVSIGSFGGNTNGKNLCLIANNYICADNSGVTGSNSFGVAIEFLTGSISDVTIVGNNITFVMPATSGNGFEYGAIETNGSLTSVSNLLISGNRINVGAVPSTFLGSLYAVDLRATTVSAILSGNLVTYADAIAGGHITGDVAVGGNVYSTSSPVRY